MQRPACPVVGAAGGRLRPLAHHCHDLLARPEQRFSGRALILPPGDGGDAHCGCRPAAPRPPRGSSRRMRRSPGSTCLSCGASRQVPPRALYPPPFEQGRPGSASVAPAGRHPVGNPAFSPRAGYTEPPLSPHGPTMAGKRPNFFKLLVSLPVNPETLCPCLTYLASGFLVMHSLIHANSAIA